MKSAVLLFVSIFFISLCSVLGQKKVALDTSIVLDNSIEDYYLEFSVPDGTDFLSYEVKGSISEGSFRTSFIDPDDNRNEGFILRTEGSSGSYAVATGKGGINAYSVNRNSNTNSNSESESSSEQRAGSGVSASSISTSKSKSKWKGAKGNMNEVLEDPQPGTWKVRVEAKNALGKCRVKVTIK